MTADLAHNAPTPASLTELDFPFAIQQLNPLILVFSLFQGLQSHEW